MTRTLIVGDLHGCAAELQTLLEQARPERLLLVGDLFTKGPDPVGCWELIEAHGGRSVLGNHDHRMLQVWQQALAGGGRSPAHAAARALQGQPAAGSWLSSLPLFLARPGWLVVHAGLHPSRGPAGTTRDQALCMRRWPDDRSEIHPFWWELWPSQAGASRTGLTIYGHDAVRGLQDHRPASLGLDTGCVYGGRLTGYLLEEDRLFSVPAQRVWSHPT